MGAGEYWIVNDIGGRYNSEEYNFQLVEVFQVPWDNSYILRLSLVGGSRKHEKYRRIWIRISQVLNREVSTTITKGNF